jgi:hypothetical protein
VAGSCQREGNSGEFLWMLYKETLGSKENCGGGDFIEHLSKF